MKTLRHMLTALAAQIPCRIDMQPAPAFACDCALRAADDIRRWNELLERKCATIGLRWSSEIGRC